ncbi:MAG: polyprenol monophosphomannose synthase [Actinomycetales bacterium]|nr:MAG: polyprenol monophosphomannose synthase [Actinomycetales bacterium]
MTKIAILVPTYNEAVSIVELLGKLTNFRSNSQYEYDLVVIDDNSPDRTADIVENLAIPWVDIIRRPGKSGIGPAYRAGFSKVLADPQYTHIATMDADGSHRVEDLPAMFAAITSSKTLILGVRWMPGGRVVNWPRSRQLLSKTGTRYAKLALGINLNDLTGGFRIYSAELLNSLKLKDMDATGYCFQIEMAMAADLAGAKTIQVPITFVERIAGESKMSFGIAIEAFGYVTKLGIARAIKGIYRR